MLQIQVLKEKPDWVKERLAVKNFKQPKLVDQIIDWMSTRRTLQISFDTTQAKYKQCFQRNRKTNVLR